MENIKSQFEELASDIKDYVAVNLELNKLRASEKGAELAASAIIHLMVTGIILIAVLFFSMALAFFLSEYFNSMYSGFLIVACIYTLIAIIIGFTNKKSFKELLMNNIIRSIMRKHK